MKRVDGKVAIVTGGSLGIGAATARVLAREGAKVAVTDIQDDAGQKLVDQITRDGGQARYWHLDVSDQDQVASVFGEVRETFGDVDVLVNNAGIAGPNKRTHEVTPEEWDKLTDVNIKGVFLCTREAIPRMLESGGGCIVNISSIYGIIGAADLPPYHASKGAVRLMTKTDALLYAKEGIRVNSVHPGFVWTKLVEDLGRESAEGVDAFRKALDAKHPIGHVGEPDDIAHGVLYLASDEAKWVTGSELVIDGGYTAQ
jgi:NAD(P)-dependent dehydrogenase (short-subunit alcohol dehydrogenase family)